MAGYPPVIGWTGASLHHPLGGARGIVRPMHSAEASPQAVAAVTHSGSAIPHALATERAWCREALLRVSRTFALNIRCLRGRMLETVRLAYLLCRAADTLEDSWPGPPAEVAARFDALLAALDGDAGAARSLSAAATVQHARADMDLLVRLPALLHVLGSLRPDDAADVRRCVRTMALGMKRYATREATRGTRVPYLDDDAELHDYCYVVAGCVGEMLTRLVARDIRDDGAETAARRLALAPVVGEALQLTNILLDWPVDVRRGRCHIPASWLARHGLAPRELVRGSDAARELSLRLASLAHGAIDRVPDYLDTIPTSEHRYRLFCLLPVLWARASLRVAFARRDFHCAPHRPRLSRASVLGEGLRGLLVHANHGATRQALGPSRAD